MFRQIKEPFSMAKKRAKKQPKSLHYEELEQRVLFSADVVPGLDNVAVEEQVIAEDVNLDVRTERQATPETVEQTAAEQRRELVIVSEDVANYDQLIADLQGGDNSRIIGVVVLEADRNGIEQVSEILSNRSGLAAVHVFTHGADGQINLGNGRLTSTTLQQNSDAVAGWGKALIESGDILFYGCNIAIDSDGQSLLDDIAQLTGADVAASDDASGHELLGGDWDLEYSSGSIETSVALSESVQQNWAADLATATAGADTPSIGAIGETFDALAGDDSEPIPLATERTDDHTFTLNHTNIDSTDFNDRITSFVVGEPGGDRQGSQDGMNVIMIDTTLAQYQELVDAAEEGTHVIEYNGETESAEAVLARAVDYATNNQETIDSISIMSHGLSGEFKLGNEWIGPDDLADHAKAWHALDEVMNDGGNIYLYGCNVAEDSEAGQVLLDGLAEVTHADVFASNDVTGTGGDWDLEAASTGDEAELERGLDTNLDADELADYADALADYSGAGWSGAQTFIDGAISFTLEVTGGGTIDWSYDGTTDTLTITDNDGTSAATSITITDNNGGLNVDSITTDTKLGSLTCNTDIVTLTMGKAISNTNVGGGSGTISSLIITDTLQNETVKIYANISSVISTSQFWDGDFNVTGDVGSIDMTGSPGKLRDSSITVNGDLDSMTVQKYEGTVSVVVTNVIGQFDMVGDYAYSYNFTTATNFSFDGSSVITLNKVNDAPTTLQATTTSNGGLSLNEDGGNDAYLIADDGIGPSGLSQITYELRFNASDLNSRLAFVSYYNSGDELSVVTEPTGELKIAVDNKLVTSSAMNYESLRDGQNHTFTLTWDNAAGNWQVFIDGIITDSGTGLAVGQTIDVGGTLIIGQEQDAEGGGFATSQRLSATLYDARFFDVVRSQEEILANYNSTLPYDEPNQIANWMFNDLSSDGIVIDTVTGNNLTVQHVSDLAFTASTPELSLAVDENATTGTVVGTILGSDADREALIASLLAADPDLVYSATTGKFYKVVNTLTYWSTAQTSAEGTVLAGVNGQLVIIRSAAENEIVWNLAKPIGDSVYIGASDQTTEGSWYWQSGGSDADQFWSGANTGTNIDGSYTNWNATQPNDLGGAEDVARLDSGDGLWYDTTITGPNQHYYAVEWDADTVLDSTQALTYSIVSQTVPGAFTIVADSGKITVADGSLLDYETATSHSVEIQVTDSGGLSYNETFTISITDVNDTPVVSGTFTRAVTEGNIGDAAVTATGTLTISDADADDSPSFADVAATAGDNAYGSFVLSSGTWTYTLDQSAVQDLDAGDTVNDTITYTATDGTTQQITVTITGTNDTPVVSGTFTGSVTEGNIGDTAVTATGAITISDVDTDDSPSFADVASTAGDNAYGSFVLTSGTWTYTLDQSAVQDLDAGDTATDTHTFTATDGTTQQITVTITGTDDAAVVSGTPTGAVTEGNIGDTAVTAIGTLTISDADADDSPSFADVAATAGDNAYGSFVLSSGTWTYTLDQSAVQDLDAGDTVNDTITYTATDGTTQQITVTITGTNDTAVISGTTTGAVTEGNIGDAAVTATGTLSISDADADDSPSFIDVAATVGDNSYGSFVLTSGTWTYTLDQSAVQHLDAGDTVTDTITFTVTDATTRQITVTITGTNDTPVVSGTFTGAVTEGNIGDAAVIATGTLSISDADANDSPSFTDVAATAGDNAYGSFVLSSGTWTYTLDQSAVQHLDAGDTVTDIHTFTATDGTTQQITVTITGTDDTALVSGTSTGSVIEDGTFTANGTLTISDVDTNDNPISFPDEASNLGDNGYGNFALTASTWTYTLNNAHAAVQALDVGETLIDTHTFTASDGSTQAVTITINGAEDAPVLGGTNTGTVAEDGTLTANGPLTISDVDTGDNPVSWVDEAATAGDNGYGTFEISSNTWIYTLNNGNTAVQALDAGQSLTDTHTFTANDGSTQVVTITIDGAEDAPTVANTIADQTATEDAAFSFTFAANTFSDVDTSDTLTYTATLDDDSALPAWLSFDAATRTFSGTPGNADVGTISVKVSSDDGSSTVFDSFDIMITNVNDAPMGIPTITGTVQEDQTLTAGTSGISDADGLGALSYQWLRDGLAIVGATNSTYTLGDGDVGAQISVQVSYTDGRGTAEGPLTSTQTAAVTNVNDAPVAFDDAVFGNENTVITGNVLTNDTDIEAAALNASLVSGTSHGSLTLNADGSFSYTPDADWNGTDSFTYTANDGALDSNVATVTITVNPVDDIDPELRGSTNPDPELFEDLATDDEQDQVVEVPTSEEPAPDPVVEDEQPPPVEEAMMPQGSADADDQLVHIEDSEIKENEEIIYLTDEMDTDIRAEEREDDHSFHYFDNDLYKDLSLSKYSAINYTAADELIPKSGDDLSILDYDSNDPNPVDVNGDYDLHRQEIDESFDTELKSQAIKAKIVTISAASFAAGFVSYLLRAGSFVSSLMSSLPLWRGFDPIAIYSGKKKKQKDRNEIPNKNEAKSETLFDGEAE